MIPGLSEIKIRRNAAGLTQQELAKLSGVSQSLIAKIESGKISPAFEKAKQLFDTLEKLHEEKSLSAEKIMRHHVYSVSPNDSVKSAALLMEKHAISQLPVIEHDKSIGTITEKGIVSKMGKMQNPIDLGKLKVSEILEEAMPVIQENTPISIVYSILSFQNAVLVAKKGKTTGIIAKSDLLKIAAKGK
jgi:predicted transcriptional regulator